MAYAIRFSNDIISDIQRGWSAFGNYKQDRWSSYADALDNCPFLCNWAETEEVTEAWEQYDGDYEDFAEELINEKSKIAFTRDKHGKLAMFHHNGLSCIGLTATNLVDAITEGKSLAKSAPSCELAQSTVGDVKVVAELGRIAIFFGDDEIETSLYLLECEELTDEQSIIEICDFGY